MKTQDLWAIYEVEKAKAHAEARALQAIADDQKAAYDRAYDARRTMAREFLRKQEEMGVSGFEAIMAMHAAGINPIEVYNPPASCMVRYIIQD